MGLILEPCDGWPAWGMAAAGRLRPVGVGSPAGALASLASRASPVTGRYPAVSPGPPGGLAQEARSAAGRLGREVRNVRANTPMRYQECSLTRNAALPGTVDAACATMILRKKCFEDL
jgi:hypothetical protein